MRVLKAKKISYSKQYENGMLSKEALTALTHAVEVAQNNEDNYLKIESLLKLFRKKVRMMNNPIEVLPIFSFSQMFLQQVKNYLTRYFHTKISRHMPKLPRKLRRRIFYKVFHHPAYIFTSYIMNILSVCSSSYEITLWRYDAEFIQMNVIKALNWAFLIYFTVDVFLKIYGMSYLYLWKDGVKSYFK